MNFQRNSTSVSTRLVSGLTLTGLIGAGLLASAPAAFAHDVLLESTPEAGETVTDVPEQVSLTFSGTPMEGQGLSNMIQISDEDGNQWQDGDVTVSGYDLQIGLCQDIPQGDYTLAYRVIYSDGHTGEEAFAFTVDDPQAPETGVPGECGVAVAGAEQPEQSEEPDQPEQPAQSAAAAQPNPTDDESDETSVAVEDDEAAPASNAVPMWVWIVGVVGVIIVVTVVVGISRRAKALNLPSDQNSEQR